MKTATKVIPVVNWSLRDSLDHNSAVCFTQTGNGDPKSLSRTKHTRPARIIAADRVGNPRGSRSSDALSELFEDLGWSEEAVDSGRLPRIKAQRPRKGYHHPARPRDIKFLLNYFGELSYYGVREIQLAQCEQGNAQGRILLAKLSIPGKIILYEQPDPPWLIAGTFLDSARELLLEAGATVETSDDGSRCTIDWDGESLRRFMLFEGLMHEVGHHIIQHFRGKRTAQVLRLRDHETLAHNFARRCRMEFEALMEGSI